MHQSLQRQSGCLGAAKSTKDQARVQRPIHNLAYATYSQDVEELGQNYPISDQADRI